MEIKDIIKKKPYLIWHVKDIDNLSEESIVEAVFNYGDWEDVQELFKILGIKKTASIFRKKISNKRHNFRPEIKNYFSLYFEKYA